MEDPTPTPLAVAEADAFLGELGISIEELRTALSESSAVAAKACGDFAATAAGAGRSDVAAALELAAEQLSQTEQGQEPTHSAVHSLLDSLPVLALRSAGAPRAAALLPSAPPRAVAPLVLVLPEPWARRLPSGSRHTVHATRSAEEAVALTRSLRPDVVLLNSALPVQSGLISELRRAGPSPHAIAVIGDLTRTAALKAWLREGAHPIISDQVRPASLLAILQRAAAAALPTPAELPYQQPLVLTNTVPRTAFDGHTRREPSRGNTRSVIVLCSRGKQALWDLSLGMRDIEVRCAHTAEGAVALAQEHWPDALLVAGTNDSEVSQHWDGLFQDLLLSDIRVVQVENAADYETAAPADPIFDKLWRRVRGQMRCKLALEAALRKATPVEGRLEGLTPASVLRLTAKERPDARVEIRTPSTLYRVRLWEGRPRAAAIFRLPSHPLLTGPAALRRMLGLRSGRLSVRSTLPREAVEHPLEGSLNEQLQQAGEQCRELQLQLSAKRWSSVNRVVVDLGTLSQIRLENEPALLAVTEQLRDDTPPALCKIPGPAPTPQQPEPPLERALQKLCTLGVVTQVVPIDTLTTGVEAPVLALERNSDPPEPPLRLLPPVQPAASEGSGQPRSQGPHTETFAFPPTAAALGEAPPTHGLPRTDRTTIPLGGAVVRQADRPAPRAPSRPTLPLSRDMLIAAQPAATPRGIQPWLRWTVATFVGGLALGALWLYRSRTGLREARYGLAPVAANTQPQATTQLLVQDPEALDPDRFHIPTNHGLVEVLLPHPGRLFIDGRFVGEGRIQRQHLSAGHHEVRIVSPEHSPLEQSVAIQAGSRTRVTYRVPPSQ